MRTRNLLAASAAFAVSLAVLGAHAADIPKPQYQKAAPASTYSWTGFYLGGHLGGAVNSGDAIVTATTATTSASTGAVGGTPGSFVAGINGGFDYQIAPAFVVGLYADQSFSWLSRSAGGAFGTSAFSLNDSNHYYGSAGGRFGVLLDPALLAYGKVGFAWGGARPDFAAVGTAKSVSDTSVGWGVGTGVEWRLNQNWSVKVEYDRFQLGDQQLGITAGSGTGAQVWTSTTKYVIDQGVFGVSYRF